MAPVGTFTMERGAFVIPLGSGPTEVVLRPQRRQVAMASRFWKR